MNKTHGDKAAANRRQDHPATSRQTHSRVSDAKAKPAQATGRKLATEAKYRQLLDTMQAAQRSSDRFKLLSEVTARLLQSEDPQAIVQELCLAVMKHLDCQVFLNFLVDESRGRLHLNACAGIPPEQAREIEWLGLGVAVCGAVAQCGKRMIAEDIRNSIDIRTALVKSFGVQAYACHPLVAQGHVIGTLSFGTATRRSFVDDDLDLMKTIADLVAVAMQRVRTEQALAETGARERARSEELATLLDAVPAAVWIAHDCEGRNITGNRLSYDWLRILPGANASKSAPEGERPETFRVFREGKEVPPSQMPVQLSAAGADVRGYEFDFVYPDDSVRSVVGNATPLRDESGAPRGSVSAFIDITQRKRAESEIRRLNRDLEERAQELETANEELEVINKELKNANLVLGKEIAERKRAEAEQERLNRDLERHSLELQITNQELQAMVYAVSHDLRGPLNLVEQFADLLLREYGDRLPEDGQRLLHLIHDHTSTVDDLAEDLLTLARLSQRTCLIQPVAMADLVREVVGQLQPMQAGRHVEVRVGDLPAAQADVSLMRQVWTHLISNALKFTRCREVGRIEIGALDQGGQTVYFVKDNGIGFDATQADRLFRAFQRLHHSEEFEGNGLGLAIVERIMRLHGGRVWTQGVAGQGAEFYFTVG